MNRLKFLVFAAAAVGLWAYLLVSVSPAGVTDSTNEAAGTLSGAPAAVAARLESQRSALQAAVVRLAGSNATWLPQPKSGKPEAPTADRFNAVRDVVAAALGDALKGNAVVAVANDAGALMAQGAADAAAPDETFPAVSIAQAAATNGTVVAVKGVNHLFYALPLASSDKNEVKAAGLVLVGLPVLPEANALSAAIAGELGLSAVGILADSNLVGSGGAGKDALATQFKNLKSGIAPVETGTVTNLGPVAFPLFVQNPALSMGVRQAIKGTPFEVVAIASTRAAVDRGAGLQKLAFSGLIGLLILALGVVALINNGATDEGPRMVVPPPVTLPPSISKPPQPPAALTMASETPAQEAHPDDFDFPANPAAAAGPSLPPPRPSMPEPTSDPFASSAPDSTTAPGLSTATLDATGSGVVPASLLAAAAAASQPVVSAPAPAKASTPFDEPEATAAYSASQLAKAISSPHLKAVASDPFEAARTQLSDDEKNQNPFDEPGDSTRVATIPAELMKAAQRSGPQTSPLPSSGTSGLHKAVAPVSAPIPAVSNPAADEEKHFQDTYRDFVAMREKCGEPADGLTYEKFKGKLLKNKETLVAKYQCRTVKFQVYEKEGKAALKASPVKD